VRVLCAVGFSIRNIDATEPNDVTPTGTAGQEQRGGCRVVVTCTISGLRAVLETVGGECGCSVQHRAMAADVKTVGVDVMKYNLSNISILYCVTSIYPSSFIDSTFYPFYFRIYKSNYLPFLNTLHYLLFFLT
jgi:hypothetical protein